MRSSIGAMARGFKRWILGGAVALSLGTVARVVTPAEPARPAPTAAGGTEPSPPRGSSFWGAHAWGTSVEAYRRGEIGKAIASERQHLEMAEIVHVSRGPEAGYVSAGLAALYSEVGALDLAEHWWGRARANLQNVMAGRVEASLELADVFRRRGRLKDAEGVFTQLSDTSLRGACLRADLLAEQGRVKAALALVQAAKDGKHGDASSAEIVRCEAVLGRAKLAGGDVVAARDHLQSAVDLARAETFRLHPRVAREEVWLAEALVWLGDLPRAERHLTTALAAYRRAYERDVQGVAEAMSVLARLQLVKGDTEFADVAAEAAIPGPDWGHPSASSVDLRALAVRAEVRLRLGTVDDALTSAFRAVHLAESMHHPGAPAIVEARARLARVMRAAGDRRAEAASREASALLAAEDEPSPLHVAVVRGALGEYEPAIDAATRALGPDAPLVAELLHDRGRALATAGDTPGALASFAEAGERREAFLARALATADDESRRTVVRSLDRETGDVVALALTDPRAAPLALTAVLRRKQRELDPPVPVDAQHAPRLASLHAQRATIGLFGSYTDVAALGALGEQLRVAALPLLSGPQEEDDPVTVARVAAALREGSMLVEYVRVEGRAAKAPAARGDRYAALVLDPRGAVTAHDLGSARDVLAAAREVRQALSAPPSAGPTPPAVRTPAHAAYARLVAPLAARLAGATSWVVAPDAGLALLPFAALVGDDGRYLVERVGISYVVSGRDLVSARRRAPSAEAPLVVAAPAFGEEGPEAEAGLLGRARFAPLASEGEAQSAAERLPGARVRLGDEANEPRLREAHGPAVLHLATRGYFAEPSRVQLAALARGLLLSPKSNPPFVVSPVAGSDAWLTAGVVLAGANRRAKGERDGVLSASELRSLDLRGTRLVFLTGGDAGEVSDGAGLSAVRRALGVAGAETQILSVWPAEPESTRALVAAYYGALAAGAGRAEALHLAQRRMIADPARTNPFHWAGLLVSGSDATLEGAPPPVPSVPPRRGCGCAVPGEVPGGWQGALGCLAALGALGARRRCAGRDRRVRPAEVRSGSRLPLQRETGRHAQIVEEPHLADGNARPSAFAREPSSTRPWRGRPRPLPRRRAIRRAT